MTSPSIALWATNISRRFNGLDGWLADVRAKLDETKAAGIDMLIAPEYWCEQWLTFKPEGTDRFGRTRAHVYLDGTHIGWLLAQDGLSAPWPSETVKPNWCD